MPASSFPNLVPSVRQTLLAIARRAIVRRLDGRDGTDPGPEHPLDPSGIDRLAPVFVTLTIRARIGDPDRLRGCIGTLDESAPLREGVAEYAERAAFADPRFPPLELPELERLRIHVSVLGPRRSIAAPHDIQLGRDGVILERGPFRGVFLPEVPIEQRWDAERLLEQLALKAGLDRTGWKNAQLWAFETETFGEARGDDQGAGG